MAEDFKKTKRANLFVVFGKPEKPPCSFSLSVGSPSLPVISRNDDFCKGLF